MMTGLSGTNCARVAGNIRMDDAKIGGITPAVLTFSGKNEP